MATVYFKGLINSGCFYYAYENRSYNVYCLSKVKLTRKLCNRKDDRAMRAIQVDRMSRCGDGHSKLGLSKMAACRHLDLM